MKARKIGRLNAGVLAILSCAVFAAGATISINAGSAPYSSNPQISQVNQSSIEEIVDQGLSAAYSTWQAAFNQGQASPNGTPVTVTWKDGSTSHGTVQCSVCTVKVTTTETEPSPPNTGGGSGDPGDGSGGGSGGGGSAPGPGGCTGTGCPGSGKVTVGPITKVT